MKGPKIKTIKAEQLEPFCTMPPAKIVMWHGVATTVRPFLPLSEMIELVGDIIDVCYDKKNETFVPTMLDFAFRVGVISKYANVEMPKEIDKQYALVYNSGLYDVIQEAISQSQLNAMRDSIRFYF